MESTYTKCRKDQGKKPPLNRLAHADAKKPVSEASPIAVKDTKPANAQQKPPRVTEVSLQTSHPIGGKGVVALRFYPPLKITMVHPSKKTEVELPSAPFPK
jgi:hypothetical protein